MGCRHGSPRSVMTDFQVLTLSALDEAKMQSSMRSPVDRRTSRVTCKLFPWRWFGSAAGLPPWRDSRACRPRTASVRVR